MIDSQLLHSLTNFGSTAVLIPVSAAFLVWLLFQPSKQLAVWWLVAAGVCIGGTGTRQDPYRDASSRLGAAGCGFHDSLAPAAYQNAPRTGDEPPNLPGQFIGSRGTF